MMNNEYTKAINAIKNSETIAVLMHTSPDGDSVGSSLAIHAYLIKSGKVSHCFSEDTEKAVSDKLSILPFSSDYNKEKLHNYDLAIVVDCGDISRLGKKDYKIFLSAKKTILLDHHLDNPRFCDINIIEVKAASTTQIIYKLLKEYNETKIDEDVANLLYAGLITDSGSFAFPSTSSETLHIAASLLEKGADNGFLSQKLLRDIELNVFKLKTKVMNESKFYDDYSIGIISISLDDFELTNTNSEHTEGLINDIINIESVKVAISVTEIKDKAYKVSFRSKNGISAEACAKCFGGGGHKYAAGCRIYGYYDDVIEKILVAVRDIING